ncbi:MAG: response regulator [Candidatus Poseidoniaceae archaeon]|nr:response regulator [Candidatus Poseidoniaceae archaeon]
MAYVSNNSDEDSPTVLIVESNAMSIQRLSSIFKIKDFNIEICQDGDKAVDEYIRLDPELVIISLDIPSLDGHLTALEMREHGGDARIVFVAPRRLATVAADAKFSAGAVAWLQKPVTGSVLDEQWDTILGVIPDAPGLEDLDELYPIDRIKPEEDDGPMPLPPLPGMALPDLPGIEAGPLPPVGELPQLEVQLPISNDPSPKKKKKGKIFFVIILLGAAAAGYYAYSTNLI